MKIRIHKHMAFLLPSDRYISGWLWGWRKYPPQFTAHRQSWGRHGFTIRIGDSLIVVTLPGKGYLR